MNSKINELYGFNEKLSELAAQAEKNCAEAFARIDANAEYCGAKVLKAFSDNKVSEPCFYGSTGYGYGDMGREVIDKVFAQALGAEDALVRFNFVSGTHALSVALFGVLRTGDKIVSVTGKPYDTLEEVIGISGEKGNGSLMDYGVEYGQVDLNADGTPDLDGITEAVKGAKVAYIQRSRGYSLRGAFTIADIEKMVKAAKKGNPDVIIMVDNCYGEFVEDREPTAVGADVIIGSLIKNAGGGIARTGGYIAGKEEYVRLASYRLTCPGIGTEVGSYISTYQYFYQGLFMAPHTVAQTLKAAQLFCQTFASLGYPVVPEAGKEYGDIIASIKFNTEKELVGFVQAIQTTSPVDSFVVPEPWDMPGYNHKVIMAAGAFVSGSSIELSADGPIKPPYAVYFQGGLTFPHAKFGILKAVQELKNSNVIRL